MGSSMLLKLLRSQSQSTARIIPLINKPILSNPPFPSKSAMRAGSPFLTHLPESECTAFQVPFLIQPEGGGRTSDNCPSQHFPSFSFGFFLNPNSSAGLNKIDVDGCASDDLRTIWADSVKKKRKRKMNKHKLRKLRKRLSRKT